MECQQTGSKGHKADDMWRVTFHSDNGGRDYHLHFVSKEAADDYINIPDAEYDEWYLNRFDAPFDASTGYRRERVIFIRPPIGRN